MSNGDGDAMMLDARDRHSTSNQQGRTGDQSRLQAVSFRNSSSNGGPSSASGSGQGSSHLNGGQSTREPSSLVNDIQRVSIDPSTPNEKEVEAYLHDIDGEETEPPQPFMADVPTGYCYDVRMRYHSELKPPENRKDFHPEDPRRIFSIYRELCVAGLIEDKLLNKTSLTARPLARVDARNVDEGEVCLVHTKRHWEEMKACQGTKS